MFKRHGVPLRKATRMERPKAKTCKAYAPGFVHIDMQSLPQMADETS